jgi:hypothetical protein
MLHADTFVPPAVSIRSCKREVAFIDTYYKPIAKATHPKWTLGSDPAAWTTYGANSATSTASVIPSPMKATRLIRTAARPRDEDCLTELSG